MSIFYSAMVRRGKSISSFIRVSGVIRGCNRRHFRAAKFHKVLKTDVPLRITPMQLLERDTGGEDCIRRNVGGLRKVLKASLSSAVRHASDHVWSTYLSVAVNQTLQILGTRWILESNQGRFLE
jgi:hypothetical protein